MKNQAIVERHDAVNEITGWVFGILFFLIGVLNTFWGNDPGYGIFVLLLSLCFFPPFSRLITIIIGRPLPVILKIFLGIFILWSALGVAELNDKIQLMLNSFAP